MVTQGFSVPVLVVDPRAVEQGCEEALTGTHSLQHQDDPVQRRQEEEDECEQEAAVIGLSHAAVYPTLAEMEETHRRTSTHTGRQNIDSRVTHRSVGVDDSWQMFA